MNDRINLLFPPGRHVSGNLWEPWKTTDKHGAPLVVKGGPNKGQPRVEYFFAIAIAKNEPGLSKLWADMATAAKQHKNARGIFPGDPTFKEPNFSWKYVDGDSTVPNQKNKRPCDKEGYPGHFVFMFSGGTPPTIYDEQNLQITTPAELPRGYYIQVYGSINPNDSDESPGIYLNYRGVRRHKPGEIIVSGPSPDEMFGAPAAGGPPPTQAGPPSGPPAASGPPAGPPAAAPTQETKDFLDPLQKRKIGPDGNVYTVQQYLDAKWPQSQIDGWADADEPPF